MKLCRVRPMVTPLPQLRARVCRTVHTFPEVTVLLWEGHITVLWYQNIRWIYFWLSLANRPPNSGNPQVITLFGQITQLALLELHITSIPPSTTLCPTTLDGTSRNYQVSSLPDGRGPSHVYYVHLHQISSLHGSYETQNVVFLGHKDSVLRSSAILLKNISTQIIVSVCSWNWVDRLKPSLPRIPQARQSILDGVQSERLIR